MPPPEDVPMTLAVDPWPW